MHVPPAIVVDAPEFCSTNQTAEAYVREALGDSAAPQASWRVRVITNGTRLVSTIENTQEEIVARREIAPGTKGCEAAMHAIGVWVGLVLDGEVVKAKKLQTKTASPTLAVALDQAKPWPKPASEEDRNYEGDAVLNHPPQKRVLELGASSFLSDGVAAPQSQAMLGASLFLVAETGRGVFVRPSFSFARALATGADTTWLGGRLDGCARIPGNYLERRGMAIDACLGTDFGYMWHPQTTIAPPLSQGIWGLGPALALHGELASALSVEIRGVSSIQFVRDEATMPLLLLRGEVGLTWRLR